MRTPTERTLNFKKQPDESCAQAARSRLAGGAAIAVFAAAVEAFEGASGELSPHGAAGRSDLIGVLLIHVSMCLLI